MKITPLEVNRGLVARFDPLVLLAYGACPSLGPRRVEGVHYFVCLGRCGPYSPWVPASSKHRSGWIRLRYKSGTPDWTGQPTYIDLEQFWIVPDVALGPASALVDHTKPGWRNLASTFFLLGRDELEAAS